MYQGKSDSRAILRRIRLGLIGVGLSAVGWMSLGRPLPVAYWLALRSLARAIYSGPDALLPPVRLLVSTGGAVRASDLKDMLQDDVLGTWTLDANTIDLLWRELLKVRPRVIIECGAGVSTLVLARYAALEMTRSGEDVCIVSIEQDSVVKESVEARLRRHGLDSYGLILHAPVSETGLYEFDPTEVRERLQGRAADWLIIDGPAGPDGCRVTTLPQLAPLCRPGTCWFLDDSFRDGELGILCEWSRLPGVTVHGIYAVGKGLGTGIVSVPGTTAS
jgi:hypothetical protein